MSIVSVHGPNTFGSKAIQEVGPVQALANATDGTIWTFRLDGATTRALTDFVWTYTPAGGSPTSPINSVTSTTIDFTTAGAKTVTLTVTGAGTGGNPYPPAGAYPITITAVTGAAPQLRMAPTSAPTSAPEEEFDPGDHTVDEVIAYAEEHPDEVEDILAAEEAGKNRVTLVNQLEAMIPFDPADHTVTEVIGYVEENPEELENVLAAEQAGKNRSTLISQLESMRPA